MRKRIGIAIVLMTTTALLPAKDLDRIPEDFPRFAVPGQENRLDDLRKLYWLHYPYVAHEPTMWDEWLVSPTLWPATGTENGTNELRREWRERLDARHVDEEGYVGTHQHYSIAHPDGWPFPAWSHGQGGWGWHFSFKDTVPPPFRNDDLTTQTGWLLHGARDKGIDDTGWNLTIEQARATVTTPEHPFEAFQSPFLQLRWQATGLGESAQPYIEWQRKGDAGFSPDRRMYFDPPGGEKIVFSLLPVYRHPAWNGEIERLQIGFDNADGDTTLTLQALFTTYDTRHNVNSQSFIAGCAAYFHWTGDLSFLRNNISRMRIALRHMMTEHHTVAEKIVHTTWVGHDGRSGLVLNPDGTKTLRYGHGIGNNYWDLIPFGAKDCYATIRYYGAVMTLAALEEEIKRHPEWNIPEGALSFEPEYLRRHAEAVKITGNEVFWNTKTGRFVACIDEDGVTHDYGYTFLNLEAIYYDFATEDQARVILNWVDGTRVVEGDTSTGADIYRWRFAPRASTRRNVDYYFWAWNAPESIPFGGQVQDGGAVLGFSYHDIMARLKVNGPDDAWARLKAILDWFDEVQAAGGYRKYYDGNREGTLQGGGTAGGLGLDHEFTESMLVPQVMLDGFLGLQPTGDGFRIDPRLPSDWPSLRVDRIHLHERVLDIEAGRDSITVRSTGVSEALWYVGLPDGDWTISILRGDGSMGEAKGITRRDSDGAARVDWKLDALGVVLRKARRQ